MAIPNVVCDYWMNDGDTPSTILDHSGNGYDLTVSGSLSQVAGPGGNLTGYEFEASQYAYHADSANDFLQGLEEISVFAAVTCDNEDGNQEVFSKFGCLRLLYNSSLNWWHCIANGSQALYTAPPLDIAGVGSTTYYGVSVTYELGSTQEVNLYINDSPAVVENPETLAETSLDNTADDFFIGARNTTTAKWNGRISRVLIANTIFTADHRAELLQYTVPLGGSSQQTLVYG